MSLVFYFSFSQHPGSGEEGLEFVIDMVARFNPIYRFYYGVFIPVVSCFHPSTLKVAIQGTNAKPRGAFALYEFVVPWLGRLYILTSFNYALFWNVHILLQMVYVTDFVGKFTSVPLWVLTEQSIWQRQNFMTLLAAILKNTTSRRSHDMNEFWDFFVCFIVFLVPVITCIYI